MPEVSVNGRRYRTPDQPTVVICFDGCDPAYIDRGVADGILPTIASFQKRGFYAIAVDEHMPPGRADLTPLAPSR